MLEQLQSRPFTRPAQALWTYREIPCAIVPNPLGIAYNGYVRLPEWHPWLAFADEHDADADVHGGLTYGPENRWIGFDTAHVGDVWSDAALDVAVVSEEEAARGRRHRDLLREVFRHDRYTIFWTLEILRDEVNHLADQVVAAR